MTGIEALAVAGTALQAVGSIQQGRAASSAAKFQAAQMEQQADIERAQSQREAIERKRQITLAGSRARALAAAGGTSLESPSVANILGGLDYEADFAMQSSLAAGENRAAGLEAGAGAKRIEGKQARTAGLIGAATALGGFAASTAGQSLYDKYKPRTSKLPWQAPGNVNPAGGYY